eukprot:Sdes_comp10772_c0_seq1m2444
MNLSCTQSLWNLVKSSIPEVESEEIKSIIGFQLIEDNESLHRELSTLQNILDEYSQETDILSRKPASLPEPPQMRQRLLSEISFFLDALKVQQPEKRFEDSRNSLLISYVQKTLERPSSVYSFSSSRPSSRSSSTHHLSNLRQLQNDELSSVVRKINIFEIEHVKDTLRCAFQKENHFLLSEIEEVQDSLELEVSHRTWMEQNSEEPPLSDLRSFASTLEKCYLEHQTVLPDSSMGAMKKKKKSVESKRKQARNRSEP